MAPKPLGRTLRSNINAGNIQDGAEDPRNADKENGNEASRKSSRQDSEPEVGIVADWLKKYDTSLYFSIMALIQNTSLKFQEHL